MTFFYVSSFIPASKWNKSNAIKNIVRINEKYNGSQNLLNVTKKTLIVGCRYIHKVDRTTGYLSCVWDAEEHLDRTY